MDGIKLYISENNMKAYICLDKGVKPDFKDIYAFLADKKIVYGIKSNVIKSLGENPVYDQQVLVAQGLEPQDGIDAMIHFKKTIEGGKPQILENGNVDYKSLNIVKNVKKGDIIATVTDATPGVEGRDIFGNTVKPKPGQPLKMKCGRNVVFENGAFIATIDGQLFVKDNKISVLPVFEVKNVDMSVGNIDFVGNIIVHNDIYSGFEVRAEGDIEVGGNVEDSVIRSGGDIVIGRGVNGKSGAYIVAEGNLTARYLENVRVEVNKNIRCDTIMHSDVKCNGNIIVDGRRGLIAGGKVSAYEFVEAKAVGSPMSTYTEIEVGINFREQEECEVIKRDMKKVEDQIEELTKVKNHLIKKTNMTSAEREILKRTLLTLKVLIGKYDELKELLENVIVTEHENPYILVRETLYSGVKINIKREILFIKDEMKHCKIINHNGNIKILAL
ncbi:hypothetical protein SAMN02746089_01034 [Caldanaerobius fijiensis DSM 17918]|uniref:Flagellar Assembly Protein A N-terminal region domain-containing protein n=1 Tax=Caldanaerobius fijiensis DSM 17918 TaxID=1121256 RepID=A0A1M4XJW5_9THEO|nr:FapA family protein [Caldanaerobius fijiensis]SHE93710.1 hypothetical protein SAMN02746089_01034 [Caldanaerobius fijiensis DSM 17918]